MWTAPLQVGGLKGEIDTGVATHHHLQRRRYNLITTLEHLKASHL
jgi:hypothetical protein